VGGGPLLPHHVPGGVEKSSAAFLLLVFVLATRIAPLGLLQGWQCLVRVGQGLDGLGMETSFRIYSKVFTPCYGYRIDSSDLSSCWGYGCRNFWLGMGGWSGGRFIAGWLLLIDSKFVLLRCALFWLPQACGTWVKNLLGHTRPVMIGHMASYPLLEASL